MKIKMLETVETKIWVAIDGGVMPAAVDAAAQRGGEMSRHEMRPERGAAEYEMIWKLVEGGTYDSVPDDAAEKLISEGHAEAV